MTAAEHNITFISIQIQVSYTLHVKSNIYIK